MLLYGNADIASALLENNNIHFYNFTSLNEKFINKLNLVPPNNLGANSEYVFDVKYMNWILSNDINFINFMRIIIDLYDGIDVFLVISNDNWSETLIESLLKLIQQRYGISAVRINEYNDIYYAEDSDFNEGYGLFNLDNDKERYTYIIQAKQIR